jgi:hypothetical protein
MRGAPAMSCVEDTTRPWSSIAWMLGWPAGNTLGSRSRSIRWVTRRAAFATVIRCSLAAMACTR